MNGTSENFMYLIHPYPPNLAQIKTSQLRPRAYINMYLHVYVNISLCT